MRITKISIRNIMGLSELEIKPGKVETVVEGANGTGKSSVLNAIRAALGSGHDATLLRKGEKKGEIVLVLEDGTKIEKTITEAKSDPKVTLQDAGRVSTPIRYIDSLLDSFSLNPVEFLTVPAKRRADLLLESMPLAITADQINKCLPKAFQIATLDGHPLDAIATKRKEIYDERTGTNRVAKDATAAVEEAKKALPADAEGGDWDFLLKEKDHALVVFDAETSVELERIGVGFGLRIDEVRNQADDRLQKDAASAKHEIADINTEIERLRNLIAELVGQKSIIEQGEARRRAEIIQERSAAIASLNDEQARAEKTYQASRTDGRDSLQMAIADIRGKRDAHIRAQSIRDLIGHREKEAATNTKASEILSASLEKLDALKESLLNALPIKGVEVRSGEVFVYEDSVKDFVPFDRANDARKIRIAIEVAKVRAKASRVPLIIADGMERLDSKQFALFEAELEAAQAEGFQTIVARVSDQEALTVRSVR